MTYACAKRVPFEQISQRGYRYGYEPWFRCLSGMYCKSVLISSYEHTYANKKAKKFMISILMYRVHWKEKRQGIPHKYLFCCGRPPCYFYGRAFVHPVNFTGGLLSDLSFLDQRAFSGRAFILQSFDASWSNVKVYVTLSSNYLSI
jgi:hypothetical protein